MSESQVAIQPGVQQFLDRHHGLWIEGRQAASESEKRLNIYNPATGGGYRLYGRCQRR
ncbi:aldehyde dehydrogenase [Enterobacter cloacae]|uniref:Aldehyde dehydrogenase n=1 Tax=Enterobacter cloacae TaxID=550 RepID=A0A377M122_ENTCL|nr:aldehyde dehydrogenase [Enterobacter cloacae]